MSELKSISKKIFKQGVVFGLLSSLQNLSGFFLLPLITKFISTEDYGIYNLILLTSTIFTLFFSLGTISSLTRYYHVSEKQSYKDSIISNLFLISICSLSILNLITWLFSDFISYLIFNHYDMSFEIFLMNLSLSLGIIQNLLLNILRFDNKAFKFSTITLSGVFINFTISLFLLIKFNLGFSALIYGLLCSNFILFLHLFISHYKRFSFRKIDLGKVKYLFDFGVKSAISGLLFYIMDWGDKYMIDKLLDLKNVGIYSLGYRLGLIINIIIITPFSLVWSNIRMQINKLKSYNSVTSLIFRVINLVSFTLISIFVFFSQEILGLFIDESYAESFSFVPIIMLSFFVYGLVNILDYGLFIEKKMNHFIFFSCFAIVVNFTLNYLLIPNYGIFSAAFTTLVTYLIYTVLTFKFSRKFYDFGFSLSITYLVIIITLCNCFISYYFNLSLFLEVIILLFEVMMIMKMTLKSGEINFLIYNFKKIKLK